MRSRLRDFGGSLEIQSGPRGTTLSASVPLGNAPQTSRTRDLGQELAAALGGSAHRT
jgi:signal transduction histidine kinase